jgi:ABC-type multidrug transport system ATPase subunit
MPEKIIEVQQLAKRFGTFQAVKEVNLTVYKGDVYGFLGPNGAGKSTTIRCLLSLIRPDQGQIRLFGQSLATHRNAILSKTGSIIEKPDFYKYLSAYQNLAIFSRISGANVSRKEIEGMLDFVGLAGREQDKVAGFSHGMKQRLGIAQTLLHQPELIILDEPTTGLDPQGIIDIRNLILRLRDEQGKTVLLSSHLLAEMELIANRMVIINKGKTVVEGEVSNLLNAEELVVQLEIDRVSAAKHWIENHMPKVEIISTTVNHLELAIPKSRLPELNKSLVEQGFQIYAIESKRKLEDYFIKMLQADVVE